MVPDRYIGVWRRDWIERRSAQTDTVTRDNSSAIWFQSPRLHVDMRINHALKTLTAPNMALLHTQIAFAGNTEVRTSGDRELCHWRPAFAYPQISGEVDCGFMEFLTPRHLIERGIDGSYVESWRRINHDDVMPRCLRFDAAADRAKQCYLMLSGDYFALGSNFAHAEYPDLPVFAWGEKQSDANTWKIRECLAPWWIERDIDIDPRFADLLLSQSQSDIWRLPFFPTIEWCLEEID
jgi:hypothetical protein